MKKTLAVMGVLGSIGAGMAAQYTVDKLLTPKVEEIVYDDNVGIAEAAVLGMGSGAISGTVGIIVTSTILASLISVWPTQN